jgi:hypothetical protein
MAERMAQPVDASRAYRPPPGGSCASWRSRVTSRTVRPPLPHHSTASRTDKPSSPVIVRSACPAPLSIPEQSIAFTECGQHRDRQSFEPPFPVGPLFAQYRLGI